MPDHAHSTNPLVQSQLERLSVLGPGADTLGLDRITRLLGRLGDPQRELPPVFHVAGTNGKGSTCAFLRGALEAAGHRVHVYTSPHLVRFNERIRVAGRLIDDSVLGPLLVEVLDRGGDIGASFFEVTTAAAFLAFARSPADACVIEVGLGGRLDATNVIERPLVTAIAGLGVDHQAFLGDTLLDIAGEKAGIAKPGVPLVTQAYSSDIAERIGTIAAAADAPLWIAERDWSIDADARFADARGTIALPQPTMPGAHQLANLGLATAMLRRQSLLRVPDAAVAAAATGTRWPARMQLLAPGPLTRRLPQGSRVWIDGAHNLSAAEAIVGALPAACLDAVIGILANKDAHGILSVLAPYLRRVRTVPVPGHAYHDPGELAATARDLGLDARPANDIHAALDMLGADETPLDVLMLGSLYLAGTVLAANDQAPD